MSNETDFETYVYVGNDKYSISSFSKIDNKLSFKDEYYFSKFQVNNYNLNDFLDKNIFKIEKKNNQFIKSVNLIVCDKKILSIFLALKKNLSNNQVTEKDKLNILADMKDYLEKNYHDYFILHLIIDNYLANNIPVEAFKTNNICQNFSIEAKFIVIPKIQFYYYEQIFKKYEIAINKIICGNYIKSYFKNVSIDECEMGLKINLGYNSNDVLLLKKNVENKGFFEKFFDFFK